MKSGIVILGLLFSIVLKAQEIEPNRTNIRPVVAGYYINPYSIAEGILLTDEKSKHLFILREFDTIPQSFFDYTAEFKTYSVSPDGKNIGFKKYEDGICHLIIYNVDSRKLSEVFSSKKYCSNLTFTSKNQIAFSANKVIYIISGKDTIKNQQADKVIDLAISPDGSKLALISKKGKLSIIETKNAKTIDNVSGPCSNLRWSPNSKRLAFNKGFLINVWDSKEKSDYNLGEGTSPVWSADSEYILYQKNTPIEMKFVNADLYISKFNAEEIHQLTNSINIFEMQPIFISANEILYLTYEDRQIIRAGLKEYKLENEKILFKVVK